MATWLLTDTSSGLGSSLAEHVLHHGEQVVLTARTVAPMAELLVQYPSAARSIGLDVTAADQRRAAIRFAEKQFGGVDVLVNNAGGEQEWRVDPLGVPPPGIALEALAENPAVRLFVDRVRDVQPAPAVPSEAV